MPENPLRKTMRDEVFLLAQDATRMLDRAAAIQDGLGHPGGRVIHDALRTAAASAARAIEEILHS